MSKKISIIIPNFNGKNLLKKNLPKIIRYFPDDEIIIVDDGSTDDSSQFLHSQYPKIKLLENHKNFGFATSANKGISAANNKLILLLNNDCYPKNDVIKAACHYFDDRNTFAVGCLEQLSSGRQRGRGIGSFKKGFLIHSSGSLDKNNTFWTFGASTFYDKEIFQKLGGFDENFNPFYWEDFDLSYRALKSGYKIYFENKAIIYHEDSSTIKNYYSKSKIAQISFRNQFLTNWKNLTDRRLLFKHFFWLPYHLIWTNIRTKGNLLTGFLMALTKLKNILILRSKNKFIFSDQEILQSFRNEN